MSKGGGKQWQTTPKNLPRMQCARAIPVTWLGSGCCQAGPLRLNTNEWIYEVYVFKMSWVLENRGDGSYSLNRLSHAVVRTYFFRNPFFMETFSFLQLPNNQFFFLKKKYYIQKLSQVEQWAPVGCMGPPGHMLCSPALDRLYAVSYYSSPLNVTFLWLYVTVSNFGSKKLTPQTLCSCDRASWAKREESIPTRCNSIDDLLSIPDVDYWLQSRHVSGIFMPIIRRKEHVLLHMRYICW